MDCHCLKESACFHDGFMVCKVEGELWLVLGLDNWERKKRPERLVN